MEHLWLTKWKLIEGLPLANNIGTANNSTKSILKFKVKGRRDNTNTLEKNVE